MRQKFVDNGVKFVNEQYDYHKHYIQFEKIIEVGVNNNENYWNNNNSKC